MANSEKTREQELLDLAAEGRTDKEIAQRLGISIDTVDTYWRRIRARSGAASRTEAVAKHVRAQAKDTLDILAKQMGIQLPDGDLSEEAMGRLGAPTGRLPARLTSFFGRERELRLLQDFFCNGEDGSGRLLTLTGSAGCGKTRLAVEAAAQAGGIFGERVWFVPLAEIEDPELLGSSICSVMGLASVSGMDPVDRAAAALGGHSSLLVLDNMEHISDAAGGVRRLLCQAKSLRCLVTSRVKLNLESEKELEVPPLETPPSDCEPDALPDFASVQLFVDRVQACRPDFRLNEGNTQSVLALVRGLEGIPLALEMAAARAAVLTPQEMLERLPERLGLLVHRSIDVQGRHKTLRAAIEWSYRLLSDGAKPFFSRLSVFRGGWTANAAETVCQEPLAIDYLADLKSSSLVQAQEKDGKMRFGLLESLREFGNEQLSAVLRDEVQRRHARFFLDMARSAELEGPKHVDWLTLLDSDQANLNIALERLIEAGDGLAIDFCAALWRYWEARGMYRQGRGWIAQALCNLGSERTSSRAKALSGGGWLAFMDGDFPQALEWIEEGLGTAIEADDPASIALATGHKGAIEVYQGLHSEAAEHLELSLAMHTTLGNTIGVSAALLYLGNLAEGENNFERADAHYVRSLAAAQKAKHKPRMAMALQFLAGSALCAGEYDRVRPFVTESLAIGKEIQEPFALAAGYWTLASVATEEGRLDEAKGLFREAAAVAKRYELVWGFPFIVESVGYLADALGQHTSGARALGASDALREAIGVPRKVNYARLYDVHLESTKSALGVARTDAEMTVGRSLTWWDAVEAILH